MGDQRAVIVDRDGTLIDVVRDEDSGGISVAFHPSHIRFLPGVIDGLKALSRAGYAIAVATNQPGPAKGQFSRGAVERTNQALLDRLAAEGVGVATLQACMHHPEGGPGGDAALVGPCECRKPAPGLLLRALEALGVEASRGWMIGDHPSDVAAARAAGVRSALVFPLNRCELCPLRGGPGVTPDLTAERFDQLAARIVGRDAAG